MKWKNLVLVRILGVGLLLLGLVIVFVKGTNSSSIEDLHNKFENQGAYLRSSSISLPIGELHYLEVGEEVLPTLVLIHGSPGEASVWEKMILEKRLFRQFHIYMIDRPGYGKSTLGGSSLGAQSAQMELFMKDKCGPCVVVGHSYGAALALQLGIDYSENVTQIISLAGTVSAQYQHPNWYNHMAKNPLINAMLPTSFRHSNREMLLLAKDLEQLKKDLGALTIPVVFFQGGEDILVDPLSPFEYLSTLEKVTIVYDSQKNHFVIWNAIDWVMESLTSYLKYCN